MPNKGCAAHVLFVHHQVRQHCCTMLMWRMKDDPNEDGILLRRLKSGFRFRGRNTAREGNSSQKLNTTHEGLSTGMAT